MFLGVLFGRPIRHVLRQFFQLVQGGLVFRVLDMHLVI